MIAVSLLGGNMPAFAPEPTSYRSAEKDLAQIGGAVSHYLKRKVEGR